MQYKILNLFGRSHITPRARELLTQVGTVEDSEMTGSELVRVIHKYDAIFMGLYPLLTADTLEKAAKLKAVASVITNPVHIDVATAKARGIAILSLENELELLNTITGTAEMSWCLLLDVVRSTPWAFEDVKSYHWEREKYRGHNLYWKTIGIFGFGRLGKWMARYARAFNMTVLACSPNLSAKECKEFSCRSVDLGTLLKESDIIAIHANLNTETKGIFNRATFKKMKSGMYIVNTADGEIVNEDDLIEALEGGIVAGYGTDVLAGEMHFAEGFKSYRLIEYAKTHRNVIITPHIGGMTHESREATDIFLAKKLVEYVRSSS